MAPQTVSGHVMSLCQSPCAIGVLLPEGVQAASFLSRIRRGRRGMRRFATMIFVEGSSSIGRCDGIEHEGRDWLVPSWLDTPDGQWTTPERIIPLDHLPLVQKSDFAWARYVVGAAIPKALISGLISPQVADRYGVILHPSLRIRFVGLQGKPCARVKI